MRIGILDDYLDTVLTSADWSALPDDCEVEVFNKNIPPEQAAQTLGKFDVLVATRERMPFPAAVVDRLPNLKLLVTTGMNNRAIDLAACKKRGIVVCGTPSMNGSTLELTWALVLGLTKHIPLNDKTMKSGAWQAALGMSLYRKTLGVVGLGKIGSGSAAMGKLFGMDVLAWSPNLTPARAAEQGVSAVDKKTLFSRSDVIVVHMVLSEKTQNLIGKAEFDAMKPTALLVNTSRGPLIDEKAILDALNSGKIGGAGLDVYWQEPLPADHPIRKARNVLLTGHMGYNTAENAVMVYPAAIENILAWRAGKPIRMLAEKK